MSREQLGIVAVAQKRRETYARFIAPPDRVAVKSHRIVVDLQKPEARTIETTGNIPRPIPKPAAAPKPIEGLSALRSKVASLSRMLSVREIELAELRAQLAPQGRRIAMGDVMAKFCQVARDEDYRVGAREYLPIDLVAARRSQSTSRPRHVCIDLVHRLSGASTSIIGRAFGVDHTSVLHAMKRAPSHMALVPVLASIHAKVLAAFEPVT